MNKITGCLMTHISDEKYIPMAIWNLDNNVDHIIVCDTSTISIKELIYSFGINTTIEYYHDPQPSDSYKDKKWDQARKRTNLLSKVKTDWILIQDTDECYSHNIRETIQQWPNIDVFSVVHREMVGIEIEDMAVKNRVKAGSNARLIRNIKGLYYDGEDEFGCHCKIYHQSGQLYKRARDTKLMLSDINMFHYHGVFHKKAVARFNEYKRLQQDNLEYIPIENQPIEFIKLLGYHSERILSQRKEENK